MISISGRVYENNFCQILKNDKKGDVLIMNKRLVSIVIPCYRSKNTIKNVTDEIRDAFSDKEDIDYELVLVNDGSPDDTFGVISAICDIDNHVTGINLSKNFGQTNAIMAGIQYANGDVMITMDDDGQHPASGIFRLIEEIDKGFDIVYADFEQKKHSLFKRITSWINNKIQILLGNREANYHVSSFIGYSKFAIRAIQNSKSPVSASSVYVTRLSKRVTSVKIEHRIRMNGKSNYSLRRLIRLWRKGITNFSTTILDLSIYAGCITGLTSFAYAIVILIRKIINPGMAIGYASTVIIMLFLAGVIMLLIGILGDYIGRMFLILVKLPNYCVREERLSIFNTNHDNAIECMK